MNTILQAQLDSIETALSTLIDSIASYNPSIPAAQTLLSADSSLQEGLRQLHTHQRNHARILQLRETIARQNDEVRSTLQRLADTRSDLLSIPTSLPPKERRYVPYTKLLDYAKRISRYTMPPNFRHTVLATTNNSTSTSGPDTVLTGTKEGEGGIGLASLRQEEKQWLDPWTGVQFTPWPSEDVMRRSALAHLQLMVEKGEGVEKFDDGVREGEQVGDGLERADDLGTEKADVGVGGTGALQKQQEKPKVFGGLDLYDPDQEG
ncbi:MAG: hypothetical protein Q9163_004928 [Psora crenata]